MKWIKRLFITAVVLGVIAGVAGYLLFRRPNWYAKPVVDPVAQEAAARRVEDKLADTQNWAAEAQAAETQARLSAPPGATQSATAPSPARTVTFTEEELNATFAKWDAVKGWRKKYGEYLTDPRIVLRDGRLVFAGTSKGIGFGSGSVLSLHFEPRVTPDGRAQIDLARILGGNLPLPQAVFNKYRERLEASVLSTLPGLQRRARIEPDGSANEEAQAATMAKLFLKVLQREPAEATLFVPVGTSQVPVKVTDVAVAEKSVSLTVELMNADEREALLERIREPYGVETAAGEAAQETDATP